MIILICLYLGFLLLTIVITPYKEKWRNYLKICYDGIQLIIISLLLCAHLYFQNLISIDLNDLGNISKAIEIFFDFGWALIGFTLLFIGISIIHLIFNSILTAKSLIEETIEESNKSKEWEFKEEEKKYQNFFGSENITDNAKYEFKIFRCFPKMFSIV